MQKLSEMLTSTANEKVKFMRDLAAGKARKASGLFRVEGKKLCGEAAHWLKVDTLFVDAEKATQYTDLIKQCLAMGACVHPVASRIIGYTSEAKTPQDVVLSAHIPHLELQPGRLVALDGVQDPGNCGAIIRTCDAAGFGGVILGAGCADPYSPKVVRSTMGSLFRVPILQVDRLSSYLAQQKLAGESIIISSLAGEDFFEHGPLPDSLILVIGSEGRGVSREVASCATIRFKLPMAGGAESLNASVAAGIMIYDIYRNGK